MCSKEIKQFFPWSTNNAEGKQTKSPYKTQYQLIVMNDDIYVDLEKLIAKERTEDQYTKVLVEGLELLNEESDTNTEIAPKAMLIHTGNSDVSMSGISTVSKSTTGSVRWNDEVEDKERTAESMKQIEQQKIENTWVKYDIKLEEVHKWIQEHVRDKKDRRSNIDT